VSGTAWRVPARQELRWRAWDGEYLVYHADSGDTHRLNAVGAAVLRVIARGAVGTAELVDRVASEIQLEADSLYEPIDDLLARFEDLGLIESFDEHRPGTDDVCDR